MNNRPIIFLAVGLVLAIAAVFLVQSYISRMEQPTIVATSTPEMETVDIVVAKTPLFFGNKIGPEHLRIVKWPADAVPPGAFQSIDAVLSEEEGRVALRPMEINEPILTSKVSGKGGRLSLSGLIEGNMRAATIRVNDIVGVGGFVLPGDRVDVMITRNMQNASKRTINDIILQNVRVLGIDQDANEAKDQPTVARSVTLEVTPLQAQKLHLAQQVGTLGLALRNLSYKDADRVQRIDVNDLRFAQANSTPKAPVRRRVARPSGDSTVKVFRALESTSYKVQKDQKPASPTPADKSVDSDALASN
ncbi:MAG: Flp pilus assembly protein CpaB [Sphingomonadales bacterium]|jgi:pilus assembly protein CpaB